MIPEFGWAGLRRPPARHHPPSEAHLVLYYLAEKSLRTRISTTTPAPFNYINAEIDRRDDGDVRIARRISDETRAKISCGLEHPTDAESHFGSHFLEMSLSSEALLDHS